MKSRRDKILVRFVQGILLLIPLVVFGWLTWQELVPTGVFVVTKSQTEPSPFIDRLLPDARVDGATITGDPSFFFVHPHRGFDRVDAEIQFKNKGASIVEFGGLARPEPEVYDLQPLQNTLLDELDWHHLERDGISLYQREPQFDSIADFLTNLPPRDQVGTYHYTLKQPYRLEGYRPRFIQQSIDVSLRGSHVFKTYIKNEELSFVVDYMDMNRDEGADGLEIVVFNEGGEAVGDLLVADDGNTQGNELASGLKTTTLRIPALPEGVYKVEVRTTRDVFIRRIRTPQQKIVFLNNVFLGDEVGYQPTPRPVRFFTQAKRLAFQTRHAEGVQTVSVGNDALEIERAYERYVAEVEQDGVVPVFSPVADLLIHTDGHVAFSRQQYFNPDPIRLTFHTDLDRLGINYVIADYTPPEQQGEWTVARASFDTRVLYQEEGTWKFVFSIPGIVSQEASVEVGDITMHWHRPPFELSDVYDYFRR